MPSPRPLTILTGASRGLGVAIAEQILRRDAVLLTMSRHPDQTQGQLSSARDAANNILAFLDRPDFGAQPVADVRGA
jgi:NAD(P)-dependent dehydrogenase (short-subunit alcohol dehydrogenase family)